MDRDGQVSAAKKMENAFAKPVDQVLSALEVQPSTGLTDAQVTALRKKHGKNGKPTRVSMAQFVAN